MTDASQPPTPTMTTRMVGVFYAGTLAVAAGLAALGDGGVQRLWRAPPADVLAPWWAEGLALGAALLALSWAAEAIWPAMRRLTSELAAALGPISLGTAVLWALASGIAEEALFRGPIQDFVGWPLAALAFALMHGGTSRRLIAWSSFALCAGAGFGWLVVRHDSLWPAILAHVVVNAVNLRRLGLRAAALEAEGT